MQDLNIALVQMDVEWHHPEKNRSSVLREVAQLPEHIDLVVLPEMFSSGFSMKPHKVAESMQGDTMQFLKELAVAQNIAIAGSLAIKENDKYFNRFVFVHPSGEVNYYDKRHLFSLAGEDKVYTSGRKKEIIEYKGWRICPQVCYDLRFPVFSRNTEYYDLLLYVANWPKPRIQAWDTLLSARAIENMCYVAGVNRVGKEKSGLQYTGHSGLYNALGEAQHQSILEKASVTLYTLKHSHIEAIRSKLNFLEDRDTFTVSHEL